MLMSNYGAKIPNFICKYFRFISDVVRILNRDGENHISHHELETLAERDDVPIESMLKLKIAREVDGDYEIDRRVISFIAFSNNDYALTSPESVKKFHYSLSELNDKLLQTEETNEQVMYADQLISELRDFSDTLDGSITRLLQETLELKENVREMSARERFDHASKIIKEYVEPLNEIVEDRTDTILPLVRNISILAMQKSDTIDHNIEAKMRWLKLQTDTVHSNTERFAKKILSELFTLRKIQKTNSILTGAIGWLEKQDRLSPKGICNRYQISIHPKEFFFDAIEEIEALFEENETVIIPTIEEREEVAESHYFHLYKPEYTQKLKEHFPVDNIFRWLYDELDQRDSLTYENYCSALSLFDELQIIYSKEREVLNFDTCKLSIPIALAKKFTTDTKE